MAAGAAPGDGEVKRKVKPGVIELHGEEPALVVHYEVQDVRASTQELVASSAAVKKITVRSLDSATDLGGLAAEIVDKCRLIHPTKTGLVEQLLRQLLARMQEAAAPAPQPWQQPEEQGRQQSAPNAARLQAGPLKEAWASEQQVQEQRHRGQQQQQGGVSGGARAPQLAPTVQVIPVSVLAEGLPPGACAPPAPACDLAELEGYVEALYDDDLAARAAAAARIAALFADAHTTEALLSHPSLLPTLARLLREDGRRSLELAAAVAACFYSLSTMRQLHHVVGELQVGAQLLELCQLEVQRTAQRIREEGPGAAPGALAARMAAAAAGSGPPLAEREVRAATLLQRQQRFLLPAVGMLSNLAEDPGVQRKMVKRDLPVLLVALLGHPSLELTITALDLLRRLAIYSEAKCRMVAAGVVPRTLTLLSATAPGAVQAAALRLANNLAFDTKTRRIMVGAGVVQRLAEVLLQAPQPGVASGSNTLAAASQLPPLTMGLLYLASLEPPARQAVASGDLLPRLFDSLLRSPDLRAVPELLALMVNVCSCPAAAEWVSTGERLDRLVSRAMQGDGDELAFKLLRNLAAAGVPQLAHKMAPHVSGFVKLLQDPRGVTADLTCEVLATLSSVFDAVPMLPEDGDCGVGVGAAAAAAAFPGALSWNALLIGCDVFGLLASCLSGGLEDDVLLEAVVLAGAVAGHSTLAQQLADSGVLPVLSTLMADKCSDDEFVLQAAWAFARAFSQQPTCDVLLNETQAVPYLVDLLSDPSPEVRAAASAGLDAVIDADGEQQGWASRLRMLKFEAHNQAWLSTAAEPGAGSSGAGAGAVQPDGGAVDYGLYAAGGQQLVVDIESYQAQAEAHHQLQLQGSGAAGYEEGAFGGGAWDEGVAAFGFGGGLYGDECEPRPRSGEAQHSWPTAAADMAPHRAVLAAH
ncbi:MAG: kinesin-associated protein-domain-containing protein [Monoraphidium minutum]|nr:MAG: kinesin-associated protein-domain-containing protein [Monoraphidium minutum]